jgi:deoxyribonuclease-4
MKKSPEDQLLIGAHTSIAGGVHNALIEGASIGATTVQIFTSNQRQWTGKPILPEQEKLWFQTLEEKGLKDIMSHDSYLINLGSPDPEILAKSRKTFREEIERCRQLKISYLNFHPGAACGKSDEECLDTIVESLLELEPVINKGKTRLLLETTAGQGTSVGWRFEQLAHVIQKVTKKIPIGVCIDTCHIFCAGYDIRTKEAWEKTLQEFDRVIGLKYLAAFHLNDSMKPFASRRDRHACLGEGEIGLDCFKFLMTHPVTRELPKYLETPPGPHVWEKEIQLLREFAKHETHQDQKAAIF